MTILSDKDCQGYSQLDASSSNTVSTANTSLVNTTSLTMDEGQLRRQLKRVWKSILVGDLSKLKSLQTKLSDAGQDLATSKINKFGWTPLHAACYFGRLEIVKYLIE